MFLQQHPTLRHPREYKFDACGQDTVTAINKDHGAEIFLDKDARKWANKLTKDQASIASNNKQIKGLQTVTSAYAKVSGLLGGGSWMWRCERVGV